jgi:hypothetical protein
MLTKDILFGMNILTLVGLIMTGFGLILRRMGTAGLPLCLSVMGVGNLWCWLGSTRAAGRIEGSAPEREPRPRAPEAAAIPPQGRVIGAGAALATQKSPNPNTTSRSVGGLFGPRLACGPAGPAPSPPGAICQSRMGASGSGSGGETGRSYHVLPDCGHRMIPRDDQVPPHQSDRYRSQLADATGSAPEYDCGAPGGGVQNLIRASTTGFATGGPSLEGEDNEGDRRVPLRADHV